jgi:hypothetical protein
MHGVPDPLEGVAPLVREQDGGDRLQLGLALEEEILP